MAEHEKKVEVAVKVEAKVVDSIKTEPKPVKEAEKAIKIKNQLNTHAELQIDQFLRLSNKESQKCQLKVK